nr:retrovirus-related Pol polyprotein from transposon TNT 1-94 [Tanacetum cinerariifolium]
TKDETPEVIKNFLKKIYVRLQAHVIIVRTDNGTEFKNQVLKEYFDSFGTTHETSAAKTPQQNGVVKRRNRTLVEAARTMLIFCHAPLFLWAEAIATACYTQNRSIIHRRFNKTPYELIQGRKPDISYLHVFGALYYSKNDREDIGKLGAKGDIGFFIRYSANYVSYRVYNRRTRKIMKTMNVTFDELLAMVFEQNISRPGLQSMTSGQISFELELTYASSTITPQRPSKRDLDILFEPLHNEYLGGRPTEAPRAISAAPVLQNLQAPTVSMSFQDSAPVPTNSLNTLVSSHNADATSQQHAQQQRNLTPSPTASVADNVLNAGLRESYLLILLALLPLSIVWVKTSTESMVYVDDIIFGSTDPRYATLFSDLMKSRFEMSMMGEMTFFFGLQVNQSPSGIFINQSKYVHEILKKYGLNTSDIVAGSESHPPMLNKENYVPWSSRLLRYAKNDELSDKELKQIKADDQAIQTILLGLPEDIYVAVDSCETAQKIWLRVQQMMKSSDIGIQEKKAKLFNE